MKSSLLKIAVFFGLVLATTAFAQEQGLIFNYFGGGARSEGMGQAFLAISDDGSAGTWNPAGLYIHEKTFMTFSYGFLKPRGNYTYYADNDLTREYGHDGNFGAIDFWGITTPLRIKNHHYVLSLFINRNFDAYYKFGEKVKGGAGIYSGNQAPLGTQDSLPNTFYERHGGVNNASLALGTRIYKELSFGISANIYHGKIVTEENRTLKFSYAGNDLVSDIQVLDSMGFSGFNATIGLLYAGERIRGGLVVRTPFCLKGNSDSSTYRITRLNGVINGNLSDTLYVDRMTSKMEMPLMVGLGTAYHVNDNLLLAADLEFRNFAGKVVKNLDSVYFTSSGERIESYYKKDPHWKNIWQFRIGGEYIFNTAVGEIPVRLGLRNEAFPGGDVSNYEVRYPGPKGSSGSNNDSARIAYVFDYNTNQTTGLSISAGTGIRWSQIILDIAYTFTSYKQKFYQNDILKAENKWKNHHLNLTFTGYF